MTHLDLEFVRRHFPGLASGYTFFDNAGGSQTLSGVVERISEYLLSSNVQLGASYEVSQIASERVTKGQREMATYVNAAQSEEVVMGPSTTMLIKMLATELVNQWQAGDEVIVSNSDHEANRSPWTALENQGIQVRTWNLNPQTLRFEIDDLDSLITTKTRLVALTHVSNILGTINPIKQIAKHVHERGALICVDGVAYAPHRLIDVADWDVDFYAYSFYKVFGPHYALLYGKYHLLEELVGPNFSFIHEIPYKFQLGNVNFELTYGNTGLPAYLRELVAYHYPNEELEGRAALERAFTLIGDYEQQLCSRLLSFLNGLPAVRVIGEPEADARKRVPTVSFVVAGRQSEWLPLICDSHRIGIRFGDFYAKKLIEDLGLTRQNGVVRVSMVHYNTFDEVDRLIEILARALA